MKPTSFILILSLAPVIGVATTSCTTFKAAQARLHDWQEKREERRLAKKDAAEEKDKGPAEEHEAKLADAQDPPIFLDFNNPELQVAEETKAVGDRDAGFRLAGGAAPAELPGSVGEFMNAPIIGAEHRDNPVFRDDIAPPVATTASAAESSAAESSHAAADLIKAWAGSVVPVTGASIAEPLITAIMTATPTPERSVEVTTAESRPARGHGRLESATAVAGRTESIGATSENEHQRQ